MARGQAATRALLAATLLLLAATAQSRPRRWPPPPRRLSKLQYLLPNRLQDLVRRNHNCSVERRELQTRMRNLKASCKVSSEIPEDELSKIKQEGPSSQKGKCFLGCMMEGMNIIESGAFARERAERLVSTVYAEGAKRHSARDAVRACAQEVTTTDKCETGGLVFECFRRHRVGLFGSGGA